MSNVKPLVKLMVSTGVELEQLLEHTHIQLNDFIRFNQHITFRQYLALIENARRLSPKATYALTLGEQFFINHDGILACRVMSSQNTQMAMELLADYQNLFTQILHLNFDVTEDYGVFSVTERIPLGRALPHFVEYCFSALYCLGKFCLGKESMPLVFEFSYDNPGAGLEFSDFFKCDVRFNAESNQVFIPKAVLEQSILFANGDSANEYERLCQDQLQQLNSDQAILQKTKRIIREIPFNELSIERISDRLHMSPRSLRRHLQAQDVSYKTLLENERKRIALKRIQLQDISIEKLAEHLGYQNASSFSRAFKRWFGVAPHHYKQKR